MNNKPKVTLKRKDSNNRQRHSNIRSHSCSTDKNKQTAQSKSRHSKHIVNQDDPPNIQNHPSVTTHGALKKHKSFKEIDTSDEYYSYFRGKSKSKKKLQATLDEHSKLQYMNSIYMHKDKQVQYASQLVNPPRQEPSSGIEKEEISNPAILSKFKVLERHCGIDQKGRIMAKEAYKPPAYQNSKMTDSQYTISMYEGEKGKERKKLKDKSKKDLLRGAKSRKTNERSSDIGRIVTVKSSDKLWKKKNPKDANSPNYVQKYAQGELIHGVQLKLRKDSLKSAAPLLVSKSSTKNQPLEETATSPNQRETLSPKPCKIQNEDILRQIQEQESLKLNHQKLKIIYNAELIVERTKCIQFISKLCTSFSMRREAHSLAIHYMDKYMLILQKDVTPKQLKLIAMTALMLALKVDDGIMSRKLCHEYINRMEYLLQKPDFKSRSVNKFKESSRQSSTNVSKSKNQSNISELGMAIDTRKSRKQQTHHSKEMSIILALQLDMMMKFSFKLVSRSTTYWIDLLTTLWDNHISQNINWEDDLSFRSEKNKRNISHIYQIVEKMSLSLDMHSFSKPKLILSAMYLVCKMHLQEQRQHLDQSRIYAKYTESFSKSTNIIFYDKVGINELFGDFLQQLNLNISNLVECIRFIGQNLESNMKTFHFDAKNKYINHRNYEHQLSIYEGNLEIYKYQGKD